MKIAHKIETYTSDGEPVLRFTVMNSSGVYMEFTNWGARWITASVPDVQGALDNVLIGYDSLAGYLEDSYYNMKEMIEKHMHLVENAKEAMEELGVEPAVVPIRGGTDGARLSFMGLPCPNLCTGGQNFHGRFEYACADDMEKIVEVLIRIAEKYAK